MSWIIILALFYLASPTTNLTFSMECTDFCKSLSSQASGTGCRLTVLSHSFTYWSEVKMYPMMSLQAPRIAPTTHAIMTEKHQISERQLWIFRNLVECLVFVLHTVCNRGEWNLHALFLHAQTMGTLQDSLACSMFPAPRAFPTRTLAAAANPKGNCWKKMCTSISKKKKSVSAMF